MATVDNKKHKHSDGAGESYELDASGNTTDSKGPDNIDVILDIPLKITAELGMARMHINDLLKLGQGSVLELNKFAGEPMEVFANRKLIARGEVVVVNEKYGVRLTEIITPMERIERLR